MSVRPLVPALLALVLTGAVSGAVSPAQAAPTPGSSTPGASTPASSTAARQSAPALAASTPYTYVAVAPARVLDTRTNLGSAPAAPNAVLHVQVAGKGGLPATGVGAVVVNLTAVTPARGGHLTAWASGGSEPATSTVSFPAGPSVANVAIVPVGSDGAISIRNASPGTANVLADVSGYYRVADDGVVQGAFQPLAPARLLDTRTTRAVPANGTVQVQVAGQGGLPVDGVGAVAVNLTAVTPAKGGHLTAWATGGSEPATSSVSFPAGQTVANLAVVPVGGDRITIRNSAPTATQVLVDVSGYYVTTSDAPLSAAGAFAPLPPARILDTRPSATVAATKTVQVQVTGEGGVPAGGVGAVVVNLTAVTPARAGHLTAWASGGTQPTTSSVSFPAGRTVANLAIVPVGANGAISILNGSNGATDVLVDVSGYYLVSPPVIDPDRGNPSTVSCPSPSFCAAVDTSGQALTFDGTRWSAPSYVAPYDDSTASDANHPLYSLSCISATFCMAGDSSGDMLRFAGSSWTVTAGVLNASGITEQALSCVSTTFCVAVGDDRAATFVNGTWNADARIDDGAGHLTSVSCVGTASCIALDSTGMAFTYNGTTWSNGVSVFTSETYDEASVSCTSTTFCEAVHGSHAASYDGAKWSASTQPAGASVDLSSVSCTSASSCVAVTLDGSALTIAGNTSTITSVDSYGEIESVSCPTVDFCATIDSYGGSTIQTDGRWSTTTVVDQGMGDLSSVSCTSSTSCIAVDQHGNFLRFDGARWTAPQTIDPRIEFRQVSCATSSLCMAIAYNQFGGWVARYNGATWTVTQLDTKDSISAVSCTSTTFCLAIDYSGDYLTFNGTTWSAPVSTGLNNFGTTLACISSTFCLTHNYRFNGTTWTSITGGGDVPDESIGCGSATYCIVPIGTSLYVFDGSAWTVRTTKGSWSRGAPVSCSSTTFCLLLGSSSYATVYDGTKPAQPVLVDPMTGFNGGLRALSCTASRFCGMVDDSHALYWN